MFLTINLVHTVGHAVESRHDIHAPEEAESAHDAKDDLISGLLQVSRILSTCNTQKENDEIRIDDEKKGRWLVFRTTSTKSHQMKRQLRKQIHLLPFQPHIQLSQGRDPEETP